MESFENSKLKPLSIAIAVDDNFRILDFNTAKMKAKGKTAKLSRKIYGPLKDERKIKMLEMLSSLKSIFTNEKTMFKSDANPFYKRVFEKVFSEMQVRFKQFNSRKIHSPTDKDELNLNHSEYNQKKKPFDPLFAVNHMCARIRNNLSRLHRRSWAHTKDIKRLHQNLYLFMAFNNNYMLPLNEKTHTQLGGS